ncbi:phosphopyruvate hydratase [Patescibacteria group bacterium]
MAKINSISARKILNSRGRWTIETKVILDDESEGIQPVPNGASEGENEAVDVEIDKALDIVNNTISEVLVGKDASDQKEIDKILVEMDGTPNKSRLGGNSILSVSLAVARASSDSEEIELYEYLSKLYSGKEKNGDISYPTPIFNVLNGGKHAQNNLSIQEFMVIPALNTPFDKALEMGVNIYHNLEELLVSEDFETAVGDEGGFEPHELSSDTALDFIKRAANVQYEVGSDVFLGMDVAAGSFYKDGIYDISEENIELNTEELLEYYNRILSKYEMIFVEDMFYEKDFKGWSDFYKKFSDKLMVVADDLVVTNPTLLAEAIKKKLANAVIVKPNQVGTLTETFEFIKLARKAKMSIVVSHRSGDNIDSFISDLALAVDADFIKSGAPVRGERVAKYNRILEVFQEH